MFEKYIEFVGETKSPNRFWSVDAEKLKLAEKRLGYAFPSELRQFFEEVGYGFYERAKGEKRRTHVNRVLSPTAIARVLKEKNDPVRPPEGFQRGFMPFFDLGEYTYLGLKPKSKSPNVVYWPDGKVLVESVVAFFDRLYKDADFYRDLI